ncbi:hypothetical protein GCM10022258_23440 [Aquimarina gracilis]
MTNGQESQFLDGYIVTFANDTLVGKIKDRKSGLRHELTDKIQIKLNNGRTKKIKKKNIISYKRGSEVFVRTHLTEQIPIINLTNETNYFLVKVVSGPAELYKHYFNDQDSGTIDWVYLLNSKNSNIYKRLPFLGYKKILKKHFGPSSEINAKLKSKKYRYVDIPALVQELNE